MIGARAKRPSPARPAVPLCGFRLSLNDLEIAAESFEKGLHVPSLFMLIERPRYLAGSALLASKQNRHDAALSLADEACAYVDERGMRHLFPQNRYVAGEVRAARGDYEQALDQFSQGETVAIEYQMRPYLWQILNAAARTLDRLGRNDEATEKREQARIVVSEIADLFEDDTLRQAFLAQALSEIEV